MPSTGLKRGTDDYKAILLRFESKVYNRSAYNPQLTLDSNPAWKARCDPVAFAESLRHIVSSLTLQVPVLKIPLNSSGLPTAATVLPTAEMMDKPQPGLAAPGQAQMPSGAGMTSQECLLAVPKHTVAWVDTNQNNRLTLCVHLPPGNPKIHCSMKIESSGLEVVLHCT